MRTYRLSIPVGSGNVLPTRTRLTGKRSAIRWRAIDTLRSCSVRRRTPYIQSCDKLSTWNYEDSVQQVKANVYRWGKLQVEILGELWTAREKLSQTGRPQSGTLVPLKTWADYCEDIGLSKRTANRWLANYDAERKQIREPEPLQIEAPKRGTEPGSLNSFFNNRKVHVTENGLTVKPGEILTPGEVDALLMRAAKLTGSDAGNWIVGDLLVYAEKMRTELSSFAKGVGAFVAGDLETAIDNVVDMEAKALTDPSEMELLSLKHDWATYVLGSVTTNETLLDECRRDMQTRNKYRKTHGLRELNVR